MALSQNFAGKRVCLTAGMVNLANDVDAVGIANDSFATFAHGAFVNSSVLPLPDSNAGAVLRVEFTENDSAVLAVSRTGSPPGGNPFRSGPPGCCVVGEYAHVFQENAATLRINPFLCRRHGGVAGSVEYEADDHLTLFSRCGIGMGGASGNTADFSCGAKLKPLPSRPDDSLGIAYACLKADRSAAEDSYHNREHVLELMYSCQVSERFKLMPHLQYTRNPAYHPSKKGGFLFGIQAAVSF